VPGADPDSPAGPRTGSDPGAGRDAGGPGPFRRRIEEYLFEHPPRGRPVAWLVAVVAVALTVGLLAQRDTGRPVEADLPFVAVPSTTSVVPSTVVVHVAGAVSWPGLYVLRESARVADAIEAAGGVVVTGRADLVNLAAPVVDGSRIWIPDADRTADPVVATNGLDGPVDVNRATAAELQDLTGIGPSLAAAIVAHRVEHGPFNDVDDLLAVTGIGPATLARFRDRVRT